MSNVYASRPTGRRRKLKTYGEDRVCIDDNCSTVLSKYNQNAQCHKHAPRRFPRTRGVLSEQTG